MSCFIGHMHLIYQLNTYLPDNLNKIWDLLLIKWESTNFSCTFCACCMAYLRHVIDFSIINQFNVFGMTHYPSNSLAWTIIYIYIMRSSGYAFSKLCMPKMSSPVLSFLQLCSQTCAQHTQLILYIEFMCGYNFMHALI